MGKLSPGERAVNWAKALSVVCAALVTLLGYTNRDVLKDWMGLTNAVEVIEQTEQPKYALEGHHHNYPAPVNGKTGHAGIPGLPGKDGRDGKDGADGKDAHINDALNLHILDDH